ncbi:hypothetical protein FOT56_27065, partial [Serratia marcescens]
QQAQLAALQQRLAAAQTVTPAPASPPASGPQPATPAVAPVATAPDASPAATAGVAAVPAPPVSPALPVPSAQPEPPVPAAPPGVPASPAERVAAPLPDAPLTLQGEAQRQAYASGVSVWQEIEASLAARQALGVDLDRSWVLQGLQDAAAGRDLQMSRSDIGEVMNTLNTRYADQARATRAQQEARGKAYRIAFSRRKGAYSDAGAWYLIADKGTGRRLRTTDLAVLTVTGTLPDGTVFDPSGAHGQSKTAKVGALLPAVAIGLQKVGVGGHLTVVVPPGKGYGEVGLPPLIPGGATLVFDIRVTGLATP